jgi:type II secretory pathway pseudopilin PulG
MKNKFTLVELLVVVAVILLLAGILLPSLTMALRRAEKIECTNNMKQSGTLFASYVNDYKEAFPDDAYGTSEPRKDTSTQRLFSELYLRKNMTELNPDPTNKKWYMSNNTALAAFPKIFKCKTGFFAPVAAGGNGANCGEVSMGISFNQSAYTATMGGTARV